MKIFYNLYRAFSSLKKSAQLAQCLAMLAIVAWPSSRLFAQAPAISYSTPQTYTTGTPITLSPVNTGGAVTAPAFTTTATISSGVSDATCMAMDKSGRLYIGESSGQILTIAPGGGTTTVFATGFANILGIAADAMGGIYFVDGTYLWKIPAGGGTAVKFFDFETLAFSSAESVAGYPGSNM